MSDQLPRVGLARDEVVAALEVMRARDVDWRSGRCFSLVHDGGEDVREVARAAHDLHLSENALNTNAFPRPMIDELIEDLGDLAAGVGRVRSAKGTTDYATLE